MRLKLSSTYRTPESLLECDQVRAIYDEFSEGLYRFLTGVLKDSDAAEDALQVTFLRLAEKGHTVQRKGSIKSWLYQVAFNEALLLRRREGTRRKHQEAVADFLQARPRAVALDNPHHVVDDMIRQEATVQVQQALERLTKVQREVVVKRIYEGKKFREIAAELDVPLPTVLARMQASLRKLKPFLNQAWLAEE